MKRALGLLLLVAGLCALFAPKAFAAVAGTASRWIGNMLVFDGTSGNNAWGFDVDGLRGDFGTGPDDYIFSNGTSLETPAGIAADEFRSASGEMTFTTTAKLGSDDGVYTFYADTLFSSPQGYIKSGTPYFIGTYGLGVALTAGAPLGGFLLSTPHDVVVRSTTFRIGAPGAGGNTNVIVRLDDSSNQCDCEFPCDTGTGTISFTCSGACTFPMNSPVAIDVNSIGDCATGPILVGDINFEYILQ